nr:uncharacterized protein LOC127321551 [Lolium perenne]
MDSDDEKEQMFLELFEEEMAAAAQDEEQTMIRKLFLEIVYALRHYDSYFRCTLDCTGMAKFSALQKCTVAMWMLAYGAPGDAADAYLWMAESTVIDCLYRFRAVEDTAWILAVNEA